MIRFVGNRDGLDGIAVAAFPNVSQCPVPGPPYALAETAKVPDKVPEPFTERSHPDPFEPLVMRRHPTWTTETEDALPM